MIYLDNAATSFPKPPQVYQEMESFFRERAANPGRAGYRLSLEAEREIETTRKALASLFGAKEPHRIIFTLNATDAINMAIKGLLNPGDHAITTSIEHNSINRPLHSLERQGIITLSSVNPSPEGFIDPDEVEKAITGKTRLIATVHASNVLGTVQPVRDIGHLARGKGLFLLIDAAQSAGLVPIDVEEEGIDLLAFTGHKALFGPPGTGGLYVGERVRLRPWREGGTGVDSQNPLHPQDMPFLLEGGTPNFVGLVGLKAGVEFVLRTGVDKMRNYGLSLVSQLRQPLEGDERFILYCQPSKTYKSTTAHSPILSLNIKGVEPQVVGMILDESFGIAVRSGLHCSPGAHKAIGSFPKGTVRISPGFFNTVDDIAQLTSSLKEITNSAKVAT